MQRKRIYQILAAGTVCAILAGTAVYAGNLPLKVNVQEVRTGGITQTIETEGHIESEEEQTYYARVTAPIASFDANAGDLVHKGELLVTYDTEDLDRNVEQAKIQAAALASGYRGSAAQAEELQKAYSDAAMQDAVYQEAYQAALTNVNDLKYNIEVVADAVNDKNKALQIEIADLQVQIAAKNAAAADDSYEPGERNEFQLEAAQLQIELARLQKEQLELQDVGAEPIENRYFDEAQMFLNEIATQRSILQQEMLGTRHAAMNAAQLNQLAQNARLADRTLAWSEREAIKAGEGVTAEITGVISDVMIAQGAIAMEGSPLFTVRDTEHVKAVVEVTSYEMADVELGQKAAVEIGGTVYEGKVSRIRMETIMDSQNNARLQVEIHIDKPDGKLYLGTDVDAVIETGEKERAILIPNSALYADDKGNYCYLMENGIVAKRYIVCGLEGDRNTEVLEGLFGGEQVITDAMTDAHVGKNVTVK